MIYFLIVSACFASLNFFCASVKKKIKNMSVPTMSQRRAASATSTTVPGTFASALETAVTAGQQALDNGLLLPDPQTQTRSGMLSDPVVTMRSPVLSNRNPAALSSAAALSAAAQSRVLPPLSSSSGRAAAGSTLFSPTVGRRTRGTVLFAPDPVIGTTIDEDPSCSPYLVDLPCLSSCACM